MRNKFLLLNFIFLFSFHNSHAQYFWTQVADFPGDPRSACVGFSFGSYGGIGLGYDGITYRRSFYMYYPNLNTWLQVNSLGGIYGDGLQRDVAASFTIGIRGYVGTGQGGSSYLNDFWEYNPITDVWTQKANFAGTPRRSAVGFSIGNDGYICCGQDANGFKKDLWKYDTLNNAWTQKQSFPGTSRRLPVAFTIGGYAYVGTGDDGTFTNDFYRYDPISDAWTTVASLPASPRYSSTAFAFLGQGYLLCGYDTTLQNKNDFWQYDPTGDSWTQLTDFPGGRRSNAVAFNIDSAGFVGTGYDTIPRNDFWKYGDSLHVDTIVTSVAASIQQQTTTTIFPNPVSDEATIVVASNSENNFPALRIYSLNGKEVTSEIELHSITNHANKISISFSRGKLPAGIYEYTVSGFASGKFVVTNRE